MQASSNLPGGDNQKTFVLLLIQLGAAFILGAVVAFTFGCHIQEACRVGFICSIFIFLLIIFTAAQPRK